MKPFGYYLYPSKFAVSTLEKPKPKPIVHVKVKRSKRKWEALKQQARLNAQRFG